MSEIPVMPPNTDRRLAAGDWLRCELQIELPDIAHSERIAVAATLLGLLIGEHGDTATSRTLALIASPIVADAAELEIARRQVLGVHEGSA